MSLIVGTAGAILSMVSNIPQVWKIRNNFTTDDLHSLSVIMHFCSACLWSVYFFMMTQMLLAIECAIVGFLHFLILMAIVRDNIYLKPTHNITDV